MTGKHVRTDAHGVSFRAGETVCRVEVGAGRLAALPERLHGRPALVVMDAAVARRQAARLDPVLVDAAGAPLPRLELPGGEDVKTPENLLRLWRRLAADNLTRDGVVVGVGGGTVLDLAGFAAATWQRGVEFLAVPTSLLACADASVGGKTAVDLDGLKNPVGAFHAAPLVVVDPDLLASLPRREWRCGMAEVVKTGILGAPGLFPALEAEAPRLRTLLAAGRDDEPPAGIHALPWSDWLLQTVTAKARVVASDYREGGRRRALNLGHTLAHALEPLLGLPHGEAVALGMCAATRLAAARGVCAERTVTRIVALLDACGLPTSVAPPALADAAPYVERDKKKSAGAVRWVLPARIGQVVLDVKIPLSEALPHLHA